MSANVPQLIREQLDALDLRLHGLATALQQICDQLQQNAEHPAGSILHLDDLLKSSVSEQTSAGLMERLASIIAELHALRGEL